MNTIRLTAAQATVRYLASQLNEEGEVFIAGVWAIFGHGNVAGMGEALYGIRESLQTYRGQNEQTMAHAAIAYAKQLGRRRAMAVTSSIGPGATNMVTAAALAHFEGTVVLHCFSSPDLLPAALEHGYYVSFAGNVTYPRADDLREAASLVPPDRILVETDSPYLAPQAVRGRRNEPAYLVHTVAALARARDEDAGVLAARAHANATAAFGLP